ncbi:hypothetical protein IMSHALPRED_009394 [Imshaugia aleurites]|uniref:DUF726-domain-containing protein n=1 Tax=Imshaugia aleurites TaxID=172621 RepID=A0A8H3IYU8_9LECA|nr:hypothetical protein IMSHALPRED_009394 [Imshaugia aleurites]
MPEQKKKIPKLPPKKKLNPSSTPNKQTAAPKEPTAAPSKSSAPAAKSSTTPASSTTAKSNNDTPKPPPKQSNAASKPSQEPKPAQAPPKTTTPAAKPGNAAPERKPSLAPRKTSTPTTKPAESPAPPAARRPSTAPRKASTPAAKATDATPVRKPSLAPRKASIAAVKQTESTAPPPARRPSTAPRKESTPAVKPTDPAQSQKTPKLPPNKTDDQSPAPSPARRPSAVPRKDSTPANNPTGTAQKSKPPKLGPKKINDESSSPSQSRRPSMPQRNSSESAAKSAAAGRKGKVTKEEDEDVPAHKVAEEEKDLKSFLSESERADLTLLIASICETMRKTIESNFDAAATLKDIGHEGQSEEERLANIDYDPGTVDVSQYDKDNKAREEREKELATPKVKALKKNALQWFDEWREVVIQRVGEAVNSKETTSKQKEKASAQGSKTTTTPIAEGRPVQKIDTGAKQGEYKPPKLEQMFPRIQTPLTKLPMQKRTLVLHSILLILLSLEHYNAASRVLLLYLTSSMKLGLNYLRDDEEKTAKGLLEAAKQIQADQELLKKTSKESENSRKWKIRLAQIGGAAVVGLSGGMAAPMMAAGVGSVMTGLGLGATAAAGYLGTVAGSTYLVGSLFGAYGGRMTGEMMQNISAEVQDFAFLPVHGERKEHDESIEAATDTRRLRVIIAISGWLLEKEEVVTPWRVLRPTAEVFALRFELEALMNLGQSIDTMVSSAAYGYAQSAMIQRTVFAEMMSAMWPMAIVKVARVVDNPFSLAKTRADKAGKVLADLLINRAQGERPVTLVGYSLGARVIWSCLTSLAERKAFGLVESAVLIGSPIPSDVGTWRVMRTAVSGRLINVYSENDYILAFLYRTSSIQYGVAGLMPVSGLLGVENVDVSETVNGHLKYRYLVGSILQKIGFEDLDKDEVAKEAEAFEKIVEEEKKQTYIKQAGEVYEKASGKGLGKELYNKYGKRIGLDSKETSSSKAPSDKVKDISDADADKQATAMEKEVEAKTQKGLMQWAVEQLYISRPSVPSTGDVKDAAANPQGAVADTTKTANKTADAATKSLLQRAKEATYLSRSGGVEGQVAANDKLSQAQSTATSAAPTGYLATAAGYIPTSYIPGFGAAGKGTGAADDVGKQAGKLQQDVGKAVKPPLKKTDSARKSLSKLAGPALKRTESAQKKMAGATKNPSQAATDAKQASQDAAKDPSKIAEKGQKQAGEITESAENAAGGVTSYIPSFGLGGSSTKAKPAAPKRAPSGPAKAKGATEKVASEATESAGKATGNAQENATDAAKTSAGYSSYLPHFGYGGSKPSQPKAAPKDAEQTVKTTVEDSNDMPNETTKQVEKTVDDAKESAKDAPRNAPQGTDDAKEMPQETTKKTKQAAEDAQKAASEGINTANDLKSKAEDSATDPASAPSNVAGALSGTATSATNTVSKAGSTVGDAAAGAQKYVPNSQGLGGDAGGKVGDMASGAASGVTSGASLLGKGVGGAANMVGGGPTEGSEEKPDVSDEKPDLGKGKEKEEDGSQPDYDTQEEEEFRTPGGESKGDGKPKERTPKKEGADDPFVDETEEDANSEDTESTIKVSQSHDSYSASSNSDGEEETSKDEKGKGYATTAANTVGDAGKGAVGVGAAAGGAAASAGGAAASGVSEGVSQLGKSKWW